MGSENATKNKAGIPALSFAQKSKIVDALLKCDHISDKDSRRSVLEQLNGEEKFAGIANGIPPGQDDREHVMNIVTTCLKYRDSLDKLVKIVAWYDLEISEPVKALKKVMFDTFFELPIISQGLFDELMAETANVQIEDHDLLDMYRESMSDGWPFADFSGDDGSERLSLIIRDLIQALPANNTLPLIEFVRRVADKVDLSVQTKLYAWCKKATNYTHVADIDRSSTQQRAPDKQLKKMFSYLLIKIDPYYVLEAKEFIVWAWFLDEYTGGAAQERYKPLPGNSKRATLDTLEQELNRLIRECMKHMNRKKVLIVELFLSFAYLNAAHCDMHRWKVNKVFGSRAISLEYPLVVRSLDRANCDDEIVMYEWRHNWERLRQQKTIIKPRFLNGEQFEEDVSLEDDMCLAFTVVPPPIEDTCKLPEGHIFTRMVSDGTSIALWPRWSAAVHDETQIREAYQTILSGCDFSELPEKIWEQRKCAPSQQDSLANRLTLFWDDPDRVPPDEALAAPER